MSVFRPAIPLLAILISASYCFADQQTKPFDPDEGTLSSVLPRIPEPMVFDLVRPLGAKRGELEINSLFRQPFDSQKTFLWAPEIEYTFADGFGIEFELPMEGRRVDSLKTAIQATLPGPFETRFIQGVQFIGEVAPDKSRHQVDALHLAGIRWNRRWTTMTMTGVRREYQDAARYALLANNSAFFDLSRDVALGLESNWKAEGILPRSLLLMPQLHIRRTRLNFQAGFGVANVAGTTYGLLSFRFSREF